VRRSVLGSRSRVQIPREYGADSRFCHRPYFVCSFDLSAPVLSRFSGLGVSFGFPHVAKGYSFLLDSLRVKSGTGFRVALLKRVARLPAQPRGPVSARIC
jgi:hypothetical protein